MNICIIMIVSFEVFCSWFLETLNGIKINLVETFKKSDNLFQSNPILSTF